MPEQHLRLCVHNTPRSLTVLRRKNTRKHGIQDAVSQKITVLQRILEMGTNLYTFLTTPAITAMLSLISEKGVTCIGRFSS